MYTITTEGFDTLAKRLENAADNLSKEIGIIVWNTAKKTKRVIARQIGSELNLPQKMIIAKLRTKRHDDYNATVILKKSARLSLRNFKPKQNKQGVQAKVYKSRGVEMTPGAFMGPKPGKFAVKLRGNVFKRRGKSRKPIDIIKGPSPHQVFIEKNQIRVVIDETSAELRKQLEKRINYLELRKSGRLNWQ